MSTPANNTRDGVLELVDVDDVTDLVLEDQVTVEFVEARPREFRRTVSGRVVEWRVEESRSVVVEDAAGYRWIVDEHGLVYREHETLMIGESADVKVLRQVMADGGIVEDGETTDQFRVVTIPMDAETAEQVRRDLVEMGVKPHVARVEEVSES